jgi:hypothetical protein
MWGHFVSPSSSASSTTIISARVPPLRPQFRTPPPIEPSIPGPGNLLSSPTPPPPPPPLPRRAPGRKEQYAASMPEYSPLPSVRSSVLRRACTHYIPPADFLSIFFVGASCPAEFPCPGGRYGCQHTLPIDEFQHFFWDGLTSF